MKIFNQKGAMRDQVQTKDERQQKKQRLWKDEKVAQITSGRGNNNDEQQ